MTSELKPCPFCGGEATSRRSLVEYKADGESPSGEYEEGISISCHTCGFEMADEYRDDINQKWNTRATPDVPELVRYKPENYQGASFMIEWSDGEYVRYDRAAEVIADLERKYVISLDKLDERTQRAEAAEAKLAQINDQKPVAWQWQTSAGEWVECDEHEAIRKVSIGKQRVRHLYAAPVASEAETIERYRKALQTIEAGHGCPSALARNALSGKEPS